AAPLAASNACGDKCVCASAKAASVNSGLREATALATTVPQVCCSVRAGCCMSAEKFSFKSREYAGMVSISSFRFIVTYLRSGSVTWQSPSELRQLQSLFTLLPVARAELIRLQGIQYAKHFLWIASDRKVSHINESNDSIWIHNKCGPLCDSFLRIENAELLSQFALDVRQHGIRQVFQVRVMCAPGVMHPFGIDAAAQDLRVAFLELLVELGKAGDLGGTDKGEVFRPEEVQLPLAGIIHVSNSFECFFRIFVRAYSCGY